MELNESDSELSESDSELSESDIELSESDIAKHGSWALQLKLFICNKDWDSAIAFLVKNPNEEEYNARVMGTNKYLTTKIGLLWPTEKKLLRPLEDDLLYEQDNYGGTLLHAAMSRLQSNNFEPEDPEILPEDTFKVVRLLLKYGGIHLTLVRNYDQGETALQDCFQSDKNSVPLAVLQELLEVGGEKLVLMQNNSGDTVLHAAMSKLRDDFKFNLPEYTFKVIRLLLKYGGKKLAMLRNNYGETVLEHCVLDDEFFSLEAIREVLEVGGEDLVILQNNKGDTILHSFLSQLNFLIMYGEDRDIPDEVAIKIVQLLLKYGGKKLTIVKNNHGNTILQYCCFSFEGSLALLREVLETGGGDLVFMQNNQGDTVLHTALSNLSDDTDSDKEAIKIVQLLLTYGGKRLTMVKNNDGNTAFRNCFSLKDKTFGSLALLREVLEVGGEDLVILQNHYGDTVLHIFLSQLCDFFECGGAGEQVSDEKIIKVVQLLLKYGGKKLTIVKNNHGNTILQYCCFPFQGSLALLQEVLETGGEDLVLKQDKRGDTVLHSFLLSHQQLNSLSEEEAIKIVQLLLKYGGKRLTMVTDKNGNTILQYCCFSFEGSLLVALLQEILETGWEDLVVVQNNQGNTVLHNVMSNLSNVSSDEDDVMSLFSSDEDPENVIDVLLLSRCREIVDTVRLLLKYGGKKLVFMKNKEGLTALQCFDGIGDIKASLPFLEAFLEIGGKDLLLMKNGTNGETILHSILKNRGCFYRYFSAKSLDCARLMLQIGGRELVLAQDDEGRTALHLACLIENEYGREMIYDLLDLGGEALYLMRDKQGRTAFYVQDEESDGYEDYPELI